MRNKIMKDGSMIFLHDEGEFISDIIFNSGHYFEEDSMRNIAENFDVSHVVDIGANIGSLSTFFSREYSSSIYAFEPCKKNFELLRHNIPNQVLFNIALGEKRSIDNLVTYKNSRGNNTIASLWEDIPDWGILDSVDQTLVARLDDFHIPKVSLIKIDVEGSELRVLYGAISTILLHRPTILIEIHKDEDLRQGKFEYDQREITTFFWSHRYEFLYKDRYNNYVFVHKQSRS